MYCSAFDRDLGAVEVLEDQDERLAAGDPRQRPREQLEDLDPVLDLALRGGQRDARVAADGRAQLGDLRELREEADQVRREVGEVGPLAAEELAASRVRK